MSDLATWLREQLDEDGRVAQAALDEAGTGDPGTLGGDGRLVFGDRAVNVWATSHIGRWHPRRVLAEVEAKRRMLVHWQDADDLLDALRFLALPYADHPGYREEWRP